MRLTSIAAPKIDIAPFKHGLLWAICALILAALTGCSSSSEEELRAESGKLDLSQASFEDAVHLKGEWLAYAGGDTSAITAYRYDDSRWRTAEVEGYFREQGFPDEGLVWYRLHLRLPEDAGPMKGFVQHADNAHALYAAGRGEEGRLLAISGQPASSAQATVLSRKPVVFSLPSDTSLVLTWAVANYDYLHGGPFYAVQIGPADAIDRMVYRRTAAAFLCYGLYLLIALFFLLHWATHRNDLQSLAVGLLSLVMGVRAVSVSGSLELLFSENVDFRLRIVLDAATYLSLNGLFGFLLWSFFPKEFASPEQVRGLPGRLKGSGQEARFLRCINTLAASGAVLTSALFVAITVFATPEVISHVLSVARWISLILIAPTLVVISMALFHRRPLAGSVAFGMLLLVTGGAHDVFLALGVLKGHPYVITYTFVGFVLIQSYTLARKNARNALLAQRSAEILREEVNRQTQDLRKATALAEEANKAKGQFLAAVSHELRTPLASILGYTEILQDELDQRTVEPQHRSFLTVIQVSAGRLLNLVNDLLDMSQIEAGRLSLHMGIINVKNVIQEAVEQTYPLTQDKGLSLESHIESDQLYAWADEVRLRQVLVNLISNAVKFTEAGGVTIRAHETLFNGGPAVAIEVRDTGYGISSAFLPHIFDRFSQEEQAYSKTPQGTGLGLAISQELIARMDGNIQVASKEGEGSAFTVVLPLVDAVLKAGQENGSGAKQALPGVNLSERRAY